MSTIVIVGGCMDIGGGIMVCGGDVKVGGSAVEIGSFYSIYISFESIISFLLRFLTSFSLISSSISFCSCF